VAGRNSGNTGRQEKEEGDEGVKGREEGKRKVYRSFRKPALLCQAAR